MVKYKPINGPSWDDVHPWLDRRWPHDVLCSVVLWPEIGRPGWRPCVELSFVKPSGLVLPARRFWQPGVLRKDEYIMSAIFKAAIECAGWADEQGDELARRVEWEAGARGFGA